MRCPVCNQIIGSVTPAHVKKHGYKNTQEFFKDYPRFNLDVERINQVYQMRSKRFLSREIKKGGIQT